MRQVPAGGRPGLVDRLRRHVPSRDELAAKPWLRPLAGKILKPELWRFTRRTVPRGVALGLFVALLLPVAHIVVVALLAVFVRANLPMALSMTLVGNPLTIPFLWWLGYRLGDMLLHLASLTGIAPVATTLQGSGTSELLTRLTGASEDTALGVLVIAAAAAVLGYLLAGVLWRYRVVRRRQKRRLAA
ncbi:DUF2062 domain-containing protein [Croceibacterium aestuarii]|uniref:DUF2062 domain-containing protein n=1 Tax=Croceibacterium aestuarii TaxID=3064139 RepID=UPI00272E89E7|nr:DUF2062 domain-containing protein [Croceibacterium sp. D39]